MSWITWVAVLVIWPLVGLGVAYLFGRFTHQGEVYGNAGQLSPPILSYLRRAKRAGVTSRAAAQTKVRREASGARRPH
jgi:hypothetical protein